MKKIKDERNCVSHDEGAISEKELLLKLNSFSKTLETALDEAYVLYSSSGASFIKLKKEIQDVIRQIQEKVRENLDPRNPDDIRRFQSELDEYEDHLHEYILEKSKKELKDLYQDLCKILPFDWLHQYGATDPSDIMIPLDMEFDKEFSRSLANINPITLNQKDMLIFKGTSNKDPKVVILTGDVGSGKTTMLSSIVEKWYKEINDIANLSSFQMLLYMQFRSPDHDNFEDYLKDRLKQTVCDFSLNLVKASILHSKCLILCDGYDEANANSKKLFESLLRLNCMEKKVVVTTRPINSKELSRKINNEKLLRINLNILGVTKENMASQVKIITDLMKIDEPKKKKIVTDISEVLKTIDYGVFSILKNPLWLNLFILLYIECPQKIGEINTVTTLYMHLKENSNKRIIEKLETNENTASEFDKFYREWSLKYHIQRKYELYQEDADVFKTKCKELSLSFDSAMSSFYNIKHTKRRLDIVKVYSYRHRSEQEYEAATIICDIIVKYYKSNKNCIEKFRKDGNNIICLALMAAGYMKEKQDNLHQVKTEQEFQNFDSSGGPLFALMIFITGILYNTNERDLLYMVIDDILDLHLKLVDEDSSDSNEDLLIAHCIETNNDQQIVKAVIGKLNNLFGGTTKTMKNRKPQNLACLPLLLPAIKPKMLHIDYYYDCVSPHLTSTIETASKDGVGLHLNLSRISENVDECISMAKTCVRFFGRLSTKGVKALPSCINKLSIRTNFEAINLLSARIQDLKELEKLCKLLEKEYSEFCSDCHY